MDTKKETLEILQTFFVKSFWISFIFLLISSALCMAMHDIQVKVVQSVFGMDEQTLSGIIVLAMSFWKILIVQFTLIPAIVIWCMRKCKCNCGCEG